MTTLNPADQAKLDEEIDRIPAYDLPSVRTQEALLENAQASDDIDYVKAVLLHTWLHYQSLEFALANYDFNTKAMADGAEDHGLTELLASNPAAVSTQIMGTNIIKASYEAAHNTSFVAAFAGVDNAEALRLIFEDLDFNDPATEPGSDDEPSIVDLSEGGE